MIVVAIPSRGLMHSRTMEDVVKNCQGFEWDLIMAHGLPQPDAQNYITEEALKLNPEYVFYVDDDQQLPRDILSNMLGKMVDHDVCVAHYPVTAKGNDAVHIRNGKFESAGMGVVLVRPRVFDKLERPYFRCDTQWIWNGVELEMSMLPPGHSPAQRHGGHDADWFQRLLKVGIEPAISDIYAGEYAMISPVIPKYGNNTQYSIETWRLPE
jgi:hypothetical protein